jgi:hypothetical protein
VGFPLASSPPHGMLLEMNTSDASRPIGIRLGAAVAVALAAGSLAAGCGSSKSSTAASAASSSAGATSAAATTAAAASSSSSGTVDGGASPSAAGSASSPLPPKPTDVGPGGPHDCSTDQLKLTIQPLHEPINHVMISATNISQVPCHLNKYPLLHTVPSQQTPIKAADSTRPAAAILLAPGATAYAGIMTNSADGSGAAGRNVPTLQLSLQPSGGGGGVGRPATVTMPTTAQYIDSSAVVTYWESDVQSATY